ncbi:MAG: hypothetical protein Alpg2KO_08520 [Alphaproteobacteria bacterium]
MMDMLNGAIGCWSALPRHIPGQNGLADLDQVMGGQIDWADMRARGQALFASIDRDALATTPVGQALAAVGRGEPQAHEAMNLVLGQDSGALADLTMDERLALAEALTHLPEPIRASPAMSQAFFALVNSTPVEFGDDLDRQLWRGVGEELARLPRLRRKDSISWQDMSDQSRLGALQQASTALWDKLAGPDAGPAPDVVPFSKGMNPQGQLPRGAWVASRRCILVNIHRAAGLDRMGHALEAVLHETVHAVQDHKARLFEQGKLQPGSRAYEDARLFALNCWRVEKMPPLPQTSDDYLGQPVEKQAMAAGQGYAGGIIRARMGHDPFAPRPNHMASMDFAMRV